MRFTMPRAAGNISAGRGRSSAEHSAVEVTAGNGKFETANSEWEEPTSPGETEFGIAVDNRVLPFPAVPGRLSIPRKASLRDLRINTRSPYGRSITVMRFIEDSVAHPCRPSDDYIVKRAVRILRHG